MREIAVVASLMIFLAVTGSKADVGKTCHVDPILSFMHGC